MAQMSLSDLHSIVRDSIANCDLGRITRAANMALRRLYAVAGPTTRYTFSTTATYTTGTVAITQGDTAITLTSGTWAAGTDGQLIQCSGEATWYGFTRTNGTTGTIGSAFAGTTLTAGTYTVAYGYYDLPTTISSAFDIWRDGRDRLRRVADEEVSRFLLGSTTPAVPLAYAIVRGTHASNSALRLLLLPFPDAVYTFTAAGRARPTLFANSAPTTEYSGLPEEYDEALHAGTLFYLWDGEDKQDRSGWWRDVWRETLNNASATQNEGLDGQYGEANGREVRLWNDDVADGP